MATRMKDHTLEHGRMSEEATMDEAIDIEYSPEELSEFLAADLVEVHADPSFKERLRIRLWDILKPRSN